MFLSVFNIKNPSQRRDDFQKFIKDYHIVVSEKPLQVKVKGCTLPSLKGDSVSEMAIVDDKFLIILDSTPFRNVHAFDLEGNWLWDIEGCNDNHGRPVTYFYGICDAVTDEAGKRQLIVGNFPVTYRTDLATGKGTTIWEIEDDTDSR